jgi:hypothetical protein
MPDPGPGQPSRPRGSVADLPPRNGGGLAPAPPRHYRDAAELLAGVTERTALDDAPGKSGARLERVVIGGHGYVVKHLDLREDWTTRASGSLRGVSLELYERGILAQLPGCINQPIVGAALEERRRGPEPGGGTGGPPGSVLLMHDVAPWLVPVTDEPIPLAQHLRFLRTWPPCTPRSGRAAPSSRWSPRCTATWSCLPGWRRRRRSCGRPLVSRISCRSWSPRAGRCWRMWRPPRRRWSRRSPTTRARWWMRWPRPRTRGRAAQRPGLVPGHQLPPPAAAQGGVDHRLPGGAGGLRHRHGAVVGPPAGPVPCWARWSSSAGRRLSVATTRSSPGGRRRRCRPLPCSGDRGPAGRLRCGRWGMGGRPGAGVRAAGPGPGPGRAGPGDRPPGTRPGRGNRRGRAGRAGRRRGPGGLRRPGRGHAPPGRPGAASGGGRRRGGAVPRPGVRSRRGRVLPEPPGPSRRGPG